MGMGRAKWGGRRVRDREGGGWGEERRQEIFYRRTCFLFALATERDHYEDPLGKRFTIVPRMYIVKMQASAHSRKRDENAKIGGE